LAFAARSAISASADADDGAVVAPDAAVGFAAGAEVAAGAAGAVVGLAAAVGALVAAGGALDCGPHATLALRSKATNDPSGDHLRDNTLT
jgi:hypothetical protein